MEVPTAGPKKFNVAKEAKHDGTLFELIQNEWQRFDPMLMFLLGNCYSRLKDSYEGESFISLAKIIQNSISKQINITLLLYR